MISIMAHYALLIKTLVACARSWRRPRAGPDTAAKDAERPPPGVRSAAGAQQYKGGV